MKPELAASGHLMDVTVPSLPACRVCGCTDDHACIDDVVGPCWWVEPDLCSHCAEPAIVAAEYDRLQQLISDDWASSDEAAELRKWARKARVALGRACTVDPRSFEP